MKRGGHRHYLTGEISALEIYTVRKNADENCLPLSLIQLIIKNQLKKYDSSYKRKREEQSTCLISYITLYKPIKRDIS